MKKAVSDSYLNQWWRKAVLKRWGNCCANCGAPGEREDDKQNGVVLECHHAVKRRYILTRWDRRNGIALCVECHKQAGDCDDFIWELLDNDDIVYLKDQRRYTYKAWCTMTGQTDAEFRRATLTDLKDYVEEEPLIL